MFQPFDEKEAERKLIQEFAKKVKAKVIKLQEDHDDGKTDGVIDLDGKKISVEARRKGYPNHRGRTCNFRNGWKTKFLVEDGGIYLNELTIKNYKDRSFVYLVDIKGYRPRCAMISSSRVEELLKQPTLKQKSTNSGSLQSVKLVPLDWFMEY